MAANVGVTYNFVAGTPAVADNVDTNFNDIVSWINTNAVHLDGSKAFSAVPSGPASDPVSANQLTRKAYVDSVAGTPVGSIMLFAGSAAPTNYLFCQGQLISRSTYAGLFAVVGTTYGAGDGSTTFALPDLQGRVPVGRDTAQTEFDVLGETGGAKTHTLTTGEMPSHTHSGSTSADGVHSHTETTVVGGSGIDFGSSWGGSTASTSSNGSHTHSFTTGSSGSGGAHNNLQPYLVLNYIIRVL